MALTDRVNFDDVYFSLPRFAKYVSSVDMMPEALVKRGVVKRDRSLQDYSLTTTDTKINYDALPQPLNSGAVNYDATLTNTETCVEQAMVVIGRKFSFSTNALASALSNQPEKDVANFVIDYFRRVRSRNLVKALTGCMAVSSMTNMIYNISTGSTIGDSNRLSKTNIASGLSSKFGDKHVEGKVMICHSVQLSNMLGLGSATYEYDPLYGKIVPKVLGMDVIVDDICTTAANSTYNSFIFGANALVCAEAKESTPFAIVNDGSVAGRQYLVVKQRYIAQPNGMTFSGTPSGTSPTEAELATSGNWGLAFTSETYVPVIRMIANCA